MTTTAAGRDDKRRKAREAQKQLLIDAVESLRETESWQRWARTRRAFRSYSWRNQVLIGLQRDTERVAGIRTWNRLGRRVVAGSKAIRILAPVPFKVEVEKGGETVEETRCTFRTVNVFAVEDTVGDPLPELPMVLADGDSHALYLERLERYVREDLGYSVRYADTGRAEGWCAPGDREIVLREGIPVNRRLATLLHEACHAMGVSYTTYGRADAEVLVEAVAHMTCTTVGLDTSGAALPYIASWSERQGLDALMKFGEVVDALASKLEAAMLDESMET